MSDPRSVGEPVERCLEVKPRRAVRPSGRARRWLGVRPRVWIRRVHLVSTLALGLWLVAVATSGAIAVYAPEGDRFLEERELFRKTPGGQLSVAEAIDSFRLARPRLTVTDAYVTHGGNVIVRVEEQRDRSYFIDGGTGRVLGSASDHGGFWDWIVRFHADPVHTVAASVGLRDWVEDEEWELPLIGWRQGATTLGAAAFVLVLMLATGLVLWWPGLKRFSRRAFSLRLRRGWYVRNYDLHKLVGVVAVPFLLMWALTGAYFFFSDEIKPVWYALTPGSERTLVEPTSTRAAGPDISPSEAVQAVERVIPAQARVVSLAPPAPDDPDAAYSSWVAYGSDPFEYGEYPGNHLVYVDRKTGEVLRNDIADGPDTTQEIYDYWWGTVHYGYPVNPLWRIAWFLFGLAPLALAMTGIGQWWLKRRARLQPRGSSLARSTRKRTVFVRARG